MITRMDQLSILALCSVLVSACGKPSDNPLTQLLSPEKKEETPSPAPGKTPLTRTAWCTPDIRESLNQSRIQFTDDHAFQSSLFKLNPDLTRGEQITIPSGRDRGTWSQKDDNTLILKMENQDLVEMKMKLVLNSPDSTGDRLYLGPNSNSLQVFDPCP